jgi:mannosyltransferase
VTVRDRPGSDDAGSDGRRPVLSLLVIVVLAGAALRFYGLDAQSLWNDELSSWEQSHQPTLADVIEKGVRPTTYPPAYQVLVYYVERWVGDSEKALRFPSAVAGVLAIVAIFFLGKQVYSQREGLVAAVLVAFSYQPIYYSQEARAYSFLLLFSILSSHFWFRIAGRLEARRAPDLSSQVGYVACAIVAIYLHYFGLLLVALQLAGLFALSATRPRQLARVACLALAVALSYVPWLPYFLEEFELKQIHIEEPGLHTLSGYWRFLFYNPGEQLKWFAGAVFAVAVVRWVTARGGELRRTSPRAWLTSPTVLLVAWFVLPFAIAYTRSKLSLPMLTYRNLIISLPAAFLLFSRAITQTVTDARLQAITAAAIAAVMLHGLFVTGGYYRLPRKEQFREAAAVVAADEDAYPNARVIAHAYSKGKFDYYLERLGASSRVDLRAGLPSDVERVRNFLAEERPDYVWFLLGHRQPERPFMEFLDQELELVFHVPLRGAFARLYRRREPGGDGG